MPNIFNSVKLTAPSKSAFDLSHDVKMSFKFGQLAPTCVIDCIPSDKFTISCDAIIRLAPLASPVMHRMDARSEYYFVPKRLLWEGWEKFITNTPIDGEIGHALPSVPTFLMHGNGDNFTELMDYMGLPGGGGPQDEPINAMPFAAYQMIYNEYYRDENLVDEVLETLEDGDNSVNMALFTEIRNRAWEHDYFTSALPFAQKGEVVNFPLAMNDVPIKKDSDPATSGLGAMVEATRITTGTDQDFFVPNQISPDPGTTSGELYADMSNVTGTTTIADLRRATKLQEWLEKAARGGSRLIEHIKTFFGVTSRDQRLQRPEYIYGTKSPVIISEVLSTAETVDLPQANMAGHGVSIIKGNYGKYFCEEHGYIIGIMSVMPKPSYQQGIPKHYLKYNNPFEHFYPQFENIGEQVIENRELMAFQDQSINGNTFGYIPRYAEYKFMNNRVAGAFRTTLDFWTMTRKFETAPQLNQDFIEIDPDSSNVNRIFAVIDPAVEKLYAHVLHKIQAIRPMSKYGTPMF